MLKLRSGYIEDEALLLTFAATAGESVRRLASCIVPPKVLVKVGENDEGLLVRDRSRNFDDLRLREILHSKRKGVH